MKKRALLIMATIMFIAAVAGYSSDDSDPVKKSYENKGDMRSDAKITQCEEECLRDFEKDYNKITDQIFKGYYDKENARQMLLETKYWANECVKECDKDNR